MEKKERKLTPAEQRRAVRFTQLSRQMEEEGYERCDCTISALKANLFSIVIMLPAVLLSMLLFFITFSSTDGEYVSVNMPLLFALFLVLIVVHEAIHGLTWGIFANRHLKSIEFGVIWEYLTPYCTCADPLTKTYYILGGIMPTLILGFGLSAVSCVLGSFLLQALSVLLIFGGGGDFLIFLKILQFPSKGKSVLFYDHPYECGFVAFVKPNA